MKITLNKAGLLPNKLHDELLEVITEQFSLTHNDENIYLNFKDINKVVTPIFEDGEQTGETISYEKKRIEIEVIGKDEENNDIYGDVVHYDDFDGQALIDNIEIIVNVHDCTPIKQPRTETDKIWDSLVYLLGV